LDALDAKLPKVLDALFEQRLSHAEFERIVAEYWRSGGFVRRAPEGTVERLLEWADGSPETAYGTDDAKVEFSCRRLFGEPGRPGAFHVSGPGEAQPSDRLADKNRPPHAHETGRIAVITRRCATFYVHRILEGRDVVVEARVEAGDVIFWAPWKAHTFDAGAHGFALFCAMGRHLSPETEHFIAEPPNGVRDLDRLPRVPYGTF